MKNDLKKIKELEILALQKGSNSLEFTEMMLLTKYMLCGHQTVIINDVYEEKVTKVCNLLATGWSISDALRNVGQYPNRFMGVISQEQRDRIRMTRLRFKIIKTNKNK